MDKREVSFNKIMAQPPRCPLCHKRMENAWDPVRRINILVCHRDEIAIAVTDPLVGQWERKAEVIPCPNCDTPMRVFFTSVGFMKAKCPNRKCGCSVKSANVDRLVMPGALTGDGIQRKEL
jgi:hypothetical protein